MGTCVLSLALIGLIGGPPAPSTRPSGPGNPPAASTLPAGLTDLPGNVWREFKPTFFGAPLDGRFVAAGWNKMVFDPVSRRAIIMDRWKDPVRDLTIYANAIIAVDPDAQRAEVLKLNNYRRQGQPNGGYRTVPLPALKDDPTPVDRHPYGCLTYVDHDHSVYLFGGANQTAGHPKDFWRFDLKRRKWEKIEAADSPPNALESVMCYDPVNKVIVLYSAGKRTYLFDVVKRTWRRAEPKVEPPNGMAAAMTYDSRRGVIYLFGGPGSTGKEWNTPGPELWRYSVKANEWTRLADCPVPARAPAMAYNSAADIVLASINAGRDQPNRECLYEPASDTWRERTLAEGSARPAGSWMCLCYDPSRDLFIYKAGAYDGAKWLVMRYVPPAAAPSPTAPPAPAPTTKSPVLRTRGDTTTNVTPSSG